MSDADLQTLQVRANQGDAAAQTELAGRMLVGRGAPWAPEEGMRLLRAAADRDEPAALRLMAVLAALGEGRPQSWSDARALVERAAALGDAQAQAALDVIGADIDPWLKPPPGRVQIEAQRVATFDAFLPPAACAWIMDRARPKLEAARVKNPEQGGANTDSYRSNTGMGFSALDTDLVLQLTHARIAAAIGAPVMHQEPTNILHYTPGQQYRPHFDFLDPGEAHFQRELQAFGQRTVTFLIYLNDDYEGGETAFPRLDWSFKGRAGDALMFWNVTRDGRPDPMTLHAGTPPARGEKWLFSKWVRDRPLPLV